MTKVSLKGVTTRLTLNTEDALALVRLVTRNRNLLPVIKSLYGTKAEKLAKKLSSVVKEETPILHVEDNSLTLYLTELKATLTIYAPYKYAYHIELQEKARGVIYRFLEKAFHERAEVWKRYVEQ